MESVVRTSLRPLFVLAFFASLAVCTLANANPIEAVRGKHYKLTRRHGPWMIMVASFNKPPEDRLTEGMTPEQAAEELVYELRRAGIPAYIFQQEEIDGTITTVDRRTQEERSGKIRNWAGGICVLAGNYPSANDPVGQRTLKYIKKKFKPEFLSDIAAQGEAGPGEMIKRVQSGGVFHTTPYRPGPLSGAFMTTNPLMSDEDLAVRKRDPLILRLNSGSEYSLLQNKGKYTVVVATFQGRYEIANGINEKKMQVSSALGDAAERAWELCTALRRAKSYGYDREFPAWVFHDHYSSIVTIGSFNSKDDPRITEIQNTFGAKVAAIKSDGSPSLSAELFAIPKKPAGNELVKTWIFDPFPQVIDVPR
jgi:hypothetical protein